MEATERFGMECRSLVYYYDTKECILNRLDRQIRPDLLSPDTKGFRADYFDNFCAGGNFGRGSKHEAGWGLGLRRGGGGG